MGVFPRTPLSGIAWSSPAAAAAAASPPDPQPRAARGGNGGGNWGILGAAAADEWNDIGARRFYRVAKSSFLGLLLRLLTAACWVQLRINSVFCPNFLLICSILKMFRIFALKFTNVNLLFNP